MNEKFTTKNIENNDLTRNTAESDYLNLVNRLREISSTIALLEKTIFG